MIIGKVAVMLGIMNVLPGSETWKLGELAPEFLAGLFERSEAVVLAEVTDGLQRIGVDFEPEPLFVCGFEIKVLQAIKGNISANTILQVIGQQKFTLGLEPPQTTQKLKMFLKFGERGWVNADNQVAWIKSGFRADDKVLAELGKLGRSNFIPQTKFARKWFCRGRKIPGRTKALINRIRKQVYGWQGK